MRVEVWHWIMYCLLRKLPQISQFREVFRSRDMTTIPKRLELVVIGFNFKWRFKKARNWLRVYVTKGIGDMDRVTRQGCDGIGDKLRKATCWMSDMTTPNKPRYSPHLLTDAAPMRSQLI